MRKKRKFCPRCGIELDIDDRFCTICGYSFSKRKKKKPKLKMILFIIAIFIAFWVIFRMIGDKPIIPEPLTTVIKGLFNKTR